MKKLIPVLSATYGLLKSENLPVRLDAEPLKKTITTFADGEQQVSECLNCISHPCINFSSEAIKTDQLLEMPYNNSVKVCPTDALFVSANGFPAVREVDCIGCGLCVNRCFFGAISLDENNHHALIEIAESDRYIWTSTPPQAEAYEIRVEQFKSIDHLISAKPLPKTYFESLYAQVLKKNKAVNGFENLLVRNVLLNLGFQAKIRAVGNNDIRFDLLATLEGNVFIGEIGLNGTDILEEPRAILDDVAILHARYGYKMEELHPLIINLTYPNKRSDVYEVITDIAKILHLNIQTVSVHYLILLNLYRKKLSYEQFISCFHIGKDNKSIEADALAIFPEVGTIDPLFGSGCYAAVK